jgi:hypothetical protein
VAGRFSALEDFQKLKPIGCADVRDPEILARLDFGSTPQGLWSRGDSNP